MKQEVDFEDYLYTSIRKLGEYSGKSFVILSGKEEGYSIIHCNEAYMQLTNYTYDELIGKSYFTLFDDVHKNPNNLKTNFEEGTTNKIVNYHFRKDTISFYAELEYFPFQNEQSETAFVLLFVQEVMSTKAELLLQNIEQKIYSAIEGEMPFEKKIKAICNEIDTFYSPVSFSTILIKGEKETVRVMTSDLFETVDLTEPEFQHYVLTDVYKKAMFRTRSTTIDSLEHPGLIEEHKQFAKQRDLNACCLMPIQNQKKKVIGLFSIYYKQMDIDRSLFIPLFKKISNLISLAYTYSISQQRIYELAYTDISTGLANHNQFMQDLDEMIKSNEKGYVEILEPSEYANIVDLYGRRAGDEILRQIAHRIHDNQNIRNVEIARFSSSAIIILHKVFEEEIGDCHQHIREVIQMPFILGDKKVYITLKIGVALFDAEVTAENAIRHADIALSYAKKQSGTHLSIFKEKKSKAIEHQMEISNHLTIALRRKEISVHLQPKINMKNGNIYSLEALARWYSPELGMVSPADFVPVAENAGKIREIDIQVLETVLAWIQRRQRAGKRPYRVAVNVSPEHFYHPTFVEDLRSLVQSYYVDPREIIIEVTENIGLVNLQKAKEILNRLKLYGFDTSVDDFGIGFSSLSYLQKFEFNELKIDQSFINKIHEKGTEAIVRAIIQLANHLEMDLVAEGVETEEQAQKLLELGCSIGQGYYYSKPLPLREIDDLLQ